MTPNLNSIFIIADGEGNQHDEICTSNCTIIVRMNENHHFIFDQTFPLKEISKPARGFY